MQIINLIGHIGRDAETKRIGERDYLSFSVACTEKRNNEESTSWYSILYPFQETLLPYLKKGQQVFVSGKLKASIYQNNNSFGIDLSVFANTLQLCGSKKEETAPVTTNQAVVSNPGSNAVPSYETVAPQPSSPFPPQQNDPDGDLPF